MATPGWDGVDLRTRTNISVCVRIRPLIEREKGAQEVRARDLVCAALDASHLRPKGVDSGAWMRQVHAAFQLRGCDASATNEERLE